MKSSARLTFPGKTDSDVELNKKTIAIGRSRESDVMLVDPYISRQQSVISSALGTYSIRNVGRNPIQVNGRTVQEAVLHDGDSILMGSTELIFHQQTSAPPELFPEEEIGDEQNPPPGEGTIFLASQTQDQSGPHLILSSKDQDPVRIDLDQDSLSIGRSPDAGLVLSDPSVSRQHCEIAREPAGFFIINRSRTNPVLVNAAPVSRERLFSGDQIRVGAHSLAFISDRDEDQRPAEAPAQKLSTPLLAAAFILTALVLILGGYVILTQIIQPWQLDQELSQGEHLMDSGQHRQAIQALEGLLEKDLSQAQEQKARSLLATATVAAAERLIGQSASGQAESLLQSFLQTYGNGDAAGPVRNRLDELRLHKAQALEANRDYQQALRAFASIRQTGPFADQARNGIRRIWLSFQQAQMKKLSVADLLKKAEQNFIAKQYLTPVNQNAYAIYKSVLALDPGNEVALQRIEQMKEFYQRHGNRHFEAGRFSRALVYFERYAIIDPDNASINARIETCRSRAVSQSAKPSSPRQVQSEPSGDSEYQEQVESMLQESGTDSSRIMKYLFEDESGEQESPW